MSGNCWSWGRLVADPSDSGWNEQQDRCCSWSWEPGLGYIGEVGGQERSQPEGEAQREAGAIKEPAEPPAAVDEAGATSAPSVVVLEAASQQYSAEWTEATVVSRRRPPASRLVAPSTPDLAAPTRSYTAYVVWGVVALLAFGLGGLISHLRDKPSEPQGLPVASPAQGLPAQGSPAQGSPAQGSPEHPADVLPEAAQAVRGGEVADEPAQLDELPTEAPRVAPRATPLVAGPPPTPAASPAPTSPVASPVPTSPAASPAPTAKPAAAPSPAPVMIPDGI